MQAVEIPARIFEESSQDELFWYIRLMVSSYVDGRIAAQVLKIKEELRAQAQEEVCVCGFHPNDQPRA